MFKTYGVATNNERELVMVVGRDKQPKENEKEVYFTDGSYGGIRLDGMVGYKLHEMSYNSPEYIALKEAYLNGVFSDMSMLVAVEKEDGSLGYIACVDTNNGTGVFYYESEIGTPVAIDNLFNTDGEEDDYWEEYMAYTDDGRIN